MTEALIREYKSGDVPQLMALWTRVFHDPEEFLRGFFRLLPDMGTAVVAVKCDAVVGAVYVINGMELRAGDKKPPVCGYIYAVAVDEAHRGRGIGEALVLAAAEKAAERESELICTLPAEDSLYGWYKKLLGLECQLYRRRVDYQCAPAEPVMRLSSTEYLLWRDMLLKDRPQLRPSNPTMELERLFCESFGGGLFACASGICAAYVEGDSAVIKELAAMDQGETGIIAASVGAALGCKTAAVYFTADSGEPYIAAAPGAIPKNCVWNLSFD